MVKKMVGFPWFAAASGNFKKLNSGRYCGDSLLFYQVGNVEEGNRVVFGHVWVGFLGVERVILVIVEGDRIFVFVKCYVLFHSLLAGRKDVRCCFFLDW